MMVYHPLFIIHQCYGIADLHCKSQVAKDKITGDIEGTESLEESLEENQQRLANLHAAEFSRIEQLWLLRCCCSTTGVRNQAASL